MDYEALSQSAERRLLEHRRRELGMSPSATSAWSRTRESPTSLLPAASIDRTGARLDVAVTAWPGEGLIPGAVVTVTVVVSNGGIEAADDVTIVAPVPSGASYRPGTLKHDGRDADDVADALLGEGFALGSLVAAGRTALTWKLDITPGLDDLIFAPTVRAAVPVVAARPLALRRGNAPTAFKTDLDTAASTLETQHVKTTHEDVETPFYELEPEEEIVETAVLSAVERQPEPPPAPVVAVAPVPEPALVRPAVAALYRTLRPGDLTFVDRLLEQNLGLLPHFVMLNFLAGVTTGDGADPLGLGGFVDREAAVLGRLKVSARLGKPLALDDDAGVPPVLDGDPATIRFADPPSAHISGAVLLSAPLSEQRLSDARAALDRPVPRWLALRLVTLALCAQDLADGAHPAAAAFRSAIASYTAQARLAFIAFATRMKLDRRLEPTRASTTQLDPAARAVIEALRAAIASDG